MCKRFTCVTFFVLLLTSTGITSAELVAQFNFNNDTATTIKDVTGNGHDGTIVGNITFGPGQYGDCLVDDGTGYVELAPESNTDIQLSFKKVKVLRRSRIPRLFGTVTIRLPSRLIRWLATRNKSDDEKKAPYLSIKYLDDDLRIHTTDSNNWFVQSRIS